MSRYIKRKFKIKINKLWKGEYQIGAFVNYDGELYLYICIIKFGISIGWIYE